jgi:hypothetical protein
MPMLGRPTDDESEHEGTNLRAVDGERTLAVPSRRGTRRSEYRDRPPTPGEQTGVEIERAGEYLRVHDPDAPDAYVCSDEWLPVER